MRAFAWLGASLHSRRLDSQCRCAFALSARLCYSDCCVVVFLAVVFHLILAIIWAVQKCEFYLKGLPDFVVATDHRPLVRTFSKGISELINPRLQHLREKVSGYQFLSLIHI